MTAHHFGRQLDPRTHVQTTTVAEGGGASPRGPFFAWMDKYTGIDVEDGAMPQIRAAIDPQAKGGEFSRAPLRQFRTRPAAAVAATRQRHALRLDQDSRRDPAPRHPQTRLRRATPDAHPASRASHPSRRSGRRRPRWHDGSPGTGEQPLRTRCSHGCGVHVRRRRGRADSPGPGVANHAGSVCTGNRLTG